MLVQILHFQEAALGRDVSMFRSNFITPRQRDGTSGQSCSGLFSSAASAAVVDASPTVTSPAPKLYPLGFKVLVLYSCCCCLCPCCCAVQAMPPRVCPKLPIKLITDPAVGGALHAIALKVYDIRRARSIKAIEWQNPGKRQEVRQQQEHYGQLRQLWQLRQHQQCVRACWHGDECHWQRHSTGSWLACCCGEAALLQDGG